MTVGLEALRRFTIRDPSHKFLSIARANLDAAIQRNATGVALVIVIGSLIYDQIRDPSSVKPPKLDGRSGVT